MRNLNPHWICVRYRGICKCGKHIYVGDKAFYWPRYRSMECDECGEKSERAIIAERSMDRYGSDCMYDS